MKKVAIYVRVSTQEQATEGYSISEQQERLKKYCEAHGWTLVDSYVDPGFSGTNTNRPALQKLLADIPHGCFDTVLVYKLDRLSRSQKDTMQLIEDVFLKNNIDFISMNENFDTGTPFGRAMIGILSVFAQLERDQIKERLSMGRVGRAKTGKWNGGQKPPVGYEYKDGQLIPIEYEAMQIRKVFDLFLNGLNGEQLSMHQIKDYMGSRYRTRYSAWTQAACVSRVLKNRIYIGEIKYGGIWYPGTHEPIISTETWEAAQQKYETYIKQFSQSQQHPFEGRYLLSGLLYCGHCGARYYMQVSSRKNAKGEIKRYYTYRCYSKSGQKSMIRMQGCPAKGYKKEVLEDIVIGEIKKLTLDPVEIDRLCAKSQPNIEDNTAILNKRISELDNQIDKLLDLYQLGNIDISKVSGRLDELNAEKEKLITELNEKKAPIPTLDLAEAHKIIADFEPVFRDGTPEMQQALVRSLIKKIVIHENDIEIYWNFCV